jgi:tetratricopeptide (TPR) repeat protein
VNEQHDEHEAVRHLVDLGYVDPVEVALREAAVRQQLDGELQQAISATKQGRIAEAIASLERLKADDPDWVGPRQLLAELHYRAGRLDEAQTEFKWLEHHGVETPRISLLAAGIAIVRREFAVALELLEYAAHVDPALPALHSIHGSVLLRFGNFDQAREAFERALSKNGDDVRALDGMAVLCLAQGDYEAAADWALSAVEKEMQYSRAHYHLGIALSQLNRPKEALAAFEACSRTDPNCAAPYYWISRIAKQQLHDRKQADNYLAQGRQLLRQRRERRAAVSSPPAPTISLPNGLT